MLQTRRITGIMLTMAVLTTACEKKQQPVLPDPPRAIKYMKLGEQMGAQKRVLSGVVKAGTTSNVSFEVSGQVLKMHKKVGDAVNKGDKLAELDQNSYQLAIKRAEHELNQAIARQKELQSKLKQEQDLFNKKYTSRSGLDTAKANYDSAVSSVGIAKTQLDLARRDLEKTLLYAPMVGAIASKDVEVYTNVNSGLSIYSIQTESRQVVEVAMPETMINLITQGQVLNMTFPPLGGDEVVEGRITEISPVSSDANAYPVQIELTETPAEIRAGMSAQVILEFTDAHSNEALTVPVAAVKPSIGKQKEGSIFVYDPEQQVVRERAIQILELKNNSLAIQGDLSAGDIVAIAGISFLHDGMKVKLLEKFENREMF